MLLLNVRYFEKTSSDSSFQFCQQKNFLFFETLKHRYYSYFELNKRTYLWNLFHHMWKQCKVLKCAFQDVNRKKIFFFHIFSFEAVVWLLNIFNYREFMIYLCRYTREYIDRMVALVKEYTLMQPVMFPVHASLLKYSIPEMQRLLFQVPNSSLCVWSTRANPIESIDELLAIRKSFNIGQVFYKLPDEQLECFFSNT